MGQSSRVNEPINYYQYVHENSIKSDIKLVLRNKVINAHKQVLGLKNAVFKKAFTSHPELEEIDILDFDSDVVKIFINFLYTGRLLRILDDRVTEELFQLAIKYSDLTLKNVCEKKLIETLKAKNAVRRLSLFRDLKKTNLIKATNIFIAKNYNNVKVQPDFKQVLEDKDAINGIFDIFGKFIFSIIFSKINLCRFWFSF